MVKLTILGMLLELYMLGQREWLELTLMLLNPIEKETNQRKEKKR
jgi:hypothetical protein